MKKLIALGISLIVILVLVVTGCTGGADTPTTEEQLAALSSRVSAIETNIGSVDIKAENDTVQWAYNQIVTIKNQIEALESPTNYQPQINSINAEIDALDDDIADIEERLDALGADDTIIVVGDQITVATSLEASKVYLEVTSSREAVVVFQVIFHTTQMIELSGDTINDILIELYADPPTICKAGLIELVPEFSLYYNPDDDTWYLERMTFYTYGTTINIGETIKVLTISGTFGDYVTANVMEIAQSGTTPNW